MILCHLTNTISIGADEGAAGVSITGCGTGRAGTDHVLSYVAWDEDNHNFKAVLLLHTDCIVLPLRCTFED